MIGVNTQTTYVPAKGQLISKANCQAVDSTKNQTNEFAFFDLKSCYVVKSNAFRWFFGESTARRFVYNFKLPLVVNLSGQPRWSTLVVNLLS